MNRGRANTSNRGGASGSSTRKTLNSQSAGSQLPSDYSAVTRRVTPSAIDPTRERVNQRIGANQDIQNSRQVPGPSDLRINSQPNPNSSGTPQSSQSHIPDVAATRNHTQSRQVRMVSMPRANAREAPRFNGEKPEELVRFLQQMEDLFKECAITDLQNKKDYLGKYADHKTEQEWRAFDYYDTGTWEEYKNELLETYPEAMDDHQGSLLRLERILREHHNVASNDAVGLMSLRRSFNAEAKKLLKAPAALSNRELVQKFLGCLAPEFQLQVINRLTLKTSVNPATQTPVQAAVQTGVQGAGGNPAPVVTTIPARRKEDQFDLAIVIAEAVDIASRAFGSLAVITDYARESVSPAKDTVKVEIEEVRTQVTTLMDRIAAKEKTDRYNHEAIMKILQQGSASYPSMRSDNQGPAPQRGNQLGNSGDCFYCQESGHMQGDCPHRLLHLDQGKIKIVENNRMRLGDGSFLPRDPTSSKSLKERVEAATAGQGGNQFYFDEAPASRPGIIQLGGAGHDQHSIYTNQVWDRRDDLIEKLRSQLQAQDTGYVTHNPLLPAQVARQPVVPQLVPQQPDASFMHQMSLMMNQMNSQQKDHNSEATSQFAVGTRSNPQGGQDEQTRSGF